MNKKHHIRHDNRLKTEMFFASMLFSAILSVYVFACTEYCGTPCQTPTVTLPGCNADPPDCVCYGQRTTTYTYYCCTRCSYWWAGHYCEFDIGTRLVRRPTSQVEACNGSCSTLVGVCRPGNCGGTVIPGDTVWDYFNEGCICQWWYY
jgi:hypothetical protein